MNIDGGLAAILGVILGAGLSSARAIYEWYSKRRRFEAAVELELRRVIRTIDAKLSWLQRPLPSDIVSHIGNRVVQIDGRDFYLGEQEQLAIPLSFWRANYKEIVSILPTSSFSAFAEAVELIEMFETKFSDMKSSFGGTVGDPKQMAAVCYRDLIQIAERLKQSKGLRAAQQGAPADAPKAAHRSELGR